MSRCLVTGGSGRLGRSVVSRLAEAGHEVVSLDLTAHPAVPADQLEIDLGDPAATSRAFAAIAPDAVVHLAAIAVPFSRPEPEIFATNTSILYHVIEATVDAGADALLVSSSPTVVGYGNPAGWHPQYLPIDEQHPLQPWHGYSASKQAMELLVEVAVRRYGNLVHFGVFRPCFVIAPEEWQGAPTQQGHTVRQRLDSPELSAVALFNYLDARDGGDFVLAWLAAAASIPNGTTFFVGAADALARDPLSTLLPRHLDGLTGADDGDEPAAGLTGTLPAFDCSLAARLLGWVPKRSWRTELLDVTGDRPGDGHGGSAAGTPAANGPAPSSPHPSSPHSSSPHPSSDEDR